MFEPIVEHDFLDTFQTEKTPLLSKCIASPVIQLYMDYGHLLHHPTHYEMRGVDNERND